MSITVLQIGFNYMCESEGSWVINSRDKYLFISLFICDHEHFAKCLTCHELSQKLKLCRF